MLGATGAAAAKLAKDAPHNYAEAVKKDEDNIGDAIVREVQTPAEEEEEVEESAQEDEAEGTKQADQTTVSTPF